MHREGHTAVGRLLLDDFLFPHSSTCPSTKMLSSRLPVPPPKRLLPLPPSSDRQNII